MSDILAEIDAEYEIIARNRKQKNRLDLLETRLIARYGDAWDGNRVRGSKVLQSESQESQPEKVCLTPKTSSNVPHTKTYKVKLYANRVATS